MQLNLRSQPDVSYNSEDIYNQGANNSMSESNLFLGKIYTSPTKFQASPAKLCNFMPDFEYGSLPAKIHVI